MIKGMSSLKRKVKALMPAVELAAKQALEASAQEVVDLMKRWCPVESGDLRDSIGWTWGAPPKGSLRITGKTRMIGKGAGRKKETLTIFAGGGDAYYARMVEFGTASHILGGLFKGATSPGTKANPFFYPAWRSLKKQVKGRATRQTNKAIKRIAAS